MSDILGSADPGYNDGYDPSNQGFQDFSTFGPWVGQYGGQTNPLTPFDPTNLLSPGTLNTSSILPITGDLPGGLGGDAGQGPGAYGATPSNAGSFLNNLLNPQNMADLSSVLGGFSSGQKANRVQQGQFAQNYDKNMMEAEQLRNQNESDALKKLAQTSYLLNGGSHFTPPTLNLNNKTYTSPNLGYGPSPASAAQMQGAQALQDQLVARLSPGGSYTPQPLSSYATPGTAENIGSYGALGSGLLGTAGLLLGNGQPNSSLGSDLSSVGSFIKGLFG